MSQISSYPKVYNLGHPALEHLLDGEYIVAQEKIDGSQFSFMLDPSDGRIICRSKGQEVYENTTDKLFAAAVETARTADLKLGWVYRGEVLMKPKHNTLSYERVPTGNVILFDIELAPDVWASPLELFDEAHRIGLEAVPTLYSGDPSDFDFEELSQLLTMTSILGGSLIEGVVIKNHRRWGKDGKFLAGKHVSEAFKETHKKAWREGNPNRQDVLEVLIDEMRSPARWAKAVQHLAERGELEHAPQDIGKLIKESQSDIGEEELDYITTKLVGHFLPKILRGATAGLPQWYKEQLTEQQFEERGRV